MDEQHFQVVLGSYITELEKIALNPGVHPSDVVHLLQENQALRHAASPDLMQKLRPGTGSLFQALREKASLMAGGMRTKGLANQALGQMASEAMPRAAANIHMENDALRRVGDVRQAEQQLHGSGLLGRTTSPAQHGGGFFGMGGGGTPGPAPQRNMTLRNVAFGAGLGTAGILGAQHYYHQYQAQQQPQVY